MNPVAEIMTTRTHWPVIVVGAGPAGLTLSGFLARYGIDVLAVERNPQTVQEPRAVSIDDESLRTMQSVGIINELVPNLVLGYGSEYFSPGQRAFLKVKPTTLEYGYPRRNAFRQPVLEAILRANLERQPNATAWFEAELTAFSQNGQGVAVKLQRHGETVALSCDYLIGCDGSRSFVRQSLGIEMHGSTFRERWPIIDLEQTTDPSRRGRAFPCPAPTARGGSSSCSTTASRTPTCWRRRMLPGFYGFMERTTRPCSGARWSTLSTPAWPTAGATAACFLPATPRI
jgi:3-(3-hydroxy-phenyl)propionate hydroxylase